MSNDKSLARLWKLQTQVNRLILDQKRDASSVSDIFQAILEGTEITISQKTSSSVLALGVVSAAFLSETHNSCVVSAEFVPGKHGIRFVSPAFLSGFGKKIEGRARPCAVSSFATSRSASMWEVQREVFGSVPTSLSHLIQLMDLQSNGRGGVLDIDGLNNLFACRNVRGGESVVVVRWCADPPEPPGWSVDGDHSLNMFFHDGHWCITTSRLEVGP